MTPPADAVDEPVLLYDTTLRDGTQREGLVLSLADKLKIARRLDEVGFPYIEGGWPGSNPKDADFFDAARSMTWRNARTGGLRLDAAPRRTRRSRRPEPPRARRGRDARRHDLRQELAAPRHRGARRDAGREPRDGRRLGRLLPVGRPRGRLRRRALLRRLQVGPRLRPRHAARGARRRCDDARALRHQRRLPHRRAARHHRGGDRLVRGRGRQRPARGSGSTSTRTPDCPWPTRWRPSRRASATSRAPSTATASAAATPTSSRSGRTLRSRWACRRSRPGST